MMGKRWEPPLPSHYNEHFRAHLSGNYYDENKDGVLNGRELDP